MPRLAFLFLSVLGSVAAAGCEVHAPPTPAAAINFPITLALVPGPNPGDAPPFVVVGNADFDLRYDQGSIQTYDLTGILAEVDLCRDEEEATGDGYPCRHDRPEVPGLVTHDGRDVAGSVALFRDEVLVGPHMGTIALSPQRDRIYVASRSDNDLTWVDLDPATGDVSCEGSGIPERCADRRRTTRRSDACGRSLELLGDPVGAIAGSVESFTGDPADADTDYVMVAHRGGRVALYLDELVGSVREPVFVHRLDGLSVDISNFTLDPATGVGWANTATTNAGRRTREISVVGVDFDPVTPACSAAFYGGRVFLSGVDDGFDTRDIAFSDDSNTLHILSRRPEAVVTVDLTGRPLNAGEVLIRSIDPVGIEPSRMEVAEMGGRRIMAVTCFDGRTVWIYDLDSHELLGVVPGFSGPFEMVLDPARELLIVGDFRDSVLRVVDLSPVLASPPGPPELALVVGVIRPVSVLR